MFADKDPLYDVLYPSLVVAAHHAKGLNREFLEALMQPIRIDRADWRHRLNVPITLVEFPVVQIARLRQNVVAARDRLARQMAAYNRSHDAGDLMALHAFRQSFDFAEQKLREALAD